MSVPVQYPSTAAAPVQLKVGPARLPVAEQECAPSVPGTWSRQGGERTCAAWPASLRAGRSTRSAAHAPTVLRQLCTRHVRLCTRTSLK
eukprot:3134569-Rhodomonas_salina.2